jgi:hypothetical protein
VCLGYIGNDIDKTNRTSLQNILELYFKFN